MKTIKYKPRVIQIFRIIAGILTLQINFLFASTPTDSGSKNNSSMCVTCAISTAATRKEESSIELVSLAPTAPAEATFSEETTSTEINLAPTTPEEASFDDDPEIISTAVLEYLAPTTPAKADFDDCELCL
jgi:hypothetical protein